MATGVIVDETKAERSARMSALSKRGWEIRRQRAAETEANGLDPSPTLVDGVLSGSVEPSDLDEGDTRLVLQAMRNIVRSKKASETAKVSAGGVLLRYEQDARSHSPTDGSPHALWRETLTLLPVPERLAFLREVQGLPPLEALERAPQEC